MVFGFVFEQLTNRIRAAQLIIKAWAEFNQGFPNGSVVKNLPAMQETQVRSPGWEDPPEEGMTTHPSILAQRIPWLEQPGGLQSMG